MKKWLTKGVHKFLQFKHAILIFYSNRPIIPLFDKIRGETGTGFSDHELFHIYQISNSVKAEGEFAEVGVYKGSSAKVLIETKGQRELHLFDAFEQGIPYSGTKDKGFEPGDYSSNYEQVKNYLKSPNVFIYKGIFPETTINNPVLEKKFAFVHLDVDVYQSTLDSLKFFYPRLAKGACLISHDYYDSPTATGGVREAFQEFFSDKPEAIIELPPSQVLIIKL